AGTVPSGGSVVHEVPAGRTLTALALAAAAALAWCRHGSILAVSGRLPLRLGQSILQSIFQIRQRRSRNTRMSAPYRGYAMLPDSEARAEIHKTGHRLTDLIVGSSAIFISVCSLALAIHHGHTMERLVEANSRPFLQFDTSNGQVRANGEVVRELSATVSNPGTGAARIERFSIALDGHLVGDWPHVLQRLRQEAVAKHILASEPAAIGQFSYGTVAPSYLKGG